MLLQQPTSLFKNNSDIHTYSNSFWWLHIVATEEEGLGQLATWYDSVKRSYKLLHLYRHQ